MPTIQSKITSQGRFQTESVAAQTPRPLPLLGHAEDIFEPRVGRLGADLKTQLDQNGMVAICKSDGPRALTREQLEKVEHLIGKSEEALHFLVITDESGGILEIDSFRKKSDWISAVGKLVPGELSPSVRDAPQVDKKVQLECIERILARFR